MTNGGLLLSDKTLFQINALDEYCMNFIFVEKYMSFRKAHAATLSTCNKWNWVFESSFLFCEKRLFTVSNNVSNWLFLQMYNFTIIMTLEKFH